LTTEAGKYPSLYRAVKSSGCYVWCKPRNVVKNERCK